MRSAAQNSRWLTGLAVVGLLLVTTGCKDGGSGVSSIFDSVFGGGSGSSGGEVFAALDSGTSGFSGGDGVTGGSQPGIASVHNPEPGSMVLFGSGMAGMALMRRRRKSRANTKRS